jgi:hypothetical protein
VTIRDWLFATALAALLAVAFFHWPEDRSTWVLWEKRMTFTEGRESTAWEPLDGFDRLADCQKSGRDILQEALPFMKSEGHKLLAVRPDGRSAAYEEGAGSTKSTIDARYLCFPGPFDARPGQAVGLPHP